MPGFDISQYPSLCRLRDWFVGDVLPVWLVQARDRDAGHFHEGLSMDGSHLSEVRLRTRTAARMIHVYADAAKLGVAPHGSVAAAVMAGEVLERDARHPDGGYVRAFSRTTGETLDQVIDLYDQACVLLALGSLSALTRDDIYRQRADELLKVLDERFAAEGGGWQEDNFNSLPRRQNPHMHLYEALIALCRATGLPRYHTRLVELGVLMRERFLNETGLLHEFFGPEWEVNEQFKSERLDPGHMAEWSWLLFASQNITESDHSKASRQLLFDALRLGQAPDGSGFLVDEVDAVGRPLVEGKRLWLQAELIKARLATGDLAGADATASGLFETYLADTPRGTWRDRFDFNGKVLATSIPASSCYHLWTAVAPLLSDAEPMAAVGINSHRRSQMAVGA